MAVALGLSPREVEAIADSDPATFSAMEIAAREKWSSTDELLAGILEMTHANYRVLLALAGVKKSDSPAPLKVPRPGRDREAVKKTVKATPKQLAGWIQRRNGGG